MEVQWRAFPLHPETPEEGLSLEELFAGTTMDVPRMLLRLRQVADSLGLAFGDRRMTYNSRLAQELGLWAESEDRGHAFHIAAFQAYFAEGKNLAEKNVLLDIAEKAGLDPTVAAKILKERSFRTAVDADWQRAGKKGITAVPAFVVDNARLTGARPYNDLVEFVRTAAGGVLQRRKE